MRGADLLFRWTADEFVVLAPSTGYRGAAVLAEDLRARVEQHAFANAGRLTVSAGVSEHRESESAPAWFKRLDEALSAAKSAGRNCVRAAQGGSSNLWAAAKGPAALSLSWQEAYECGEPTIDREHRELFELGNLLLDAASAGTTDYASIQAPLGNLLALVQKHFADEEALLAKHGYAHVELHQQAHDRLLVRAEALRAAAEAGDGTLGAVTEFLAGEVIARHILATDRDYYHLFQPASALPRR
jgi:hemerythrin